MMCVGPDRAHKSSAQRPRKKYEMISFCDGELVDDFALCLSAIVHQLEVLGDSVNTDKVVAKYLRVVPPKFAQIALFISMLLDISTLSIEEVTRRLREMEDRLRPNQVLPSSFDGKLLLIEERWLVH